VADKNKEVECFEKVLECNNILGDFAKNMRKQLIDCKDSIVVNSERPDIIVSSDDMTIGIEHCQIDVLFNIKNKKAQSMVKKHASEINKMVNKYKENDSLDDDINNGEAVEPIFRVLKDRFEYRDSFSYSSFIENFQRVCKEHNDKSNAYRNNLEILYSAKTIKLGCLVDIPYPNERAYAISYNKGIRNQYMDGIPVTNGILNVVQTMKGFDFVILCMHCFDSKSRSTKCYYFCPSNMEMGIKQQRIPIIYSFDLLSPYGFEKEMNIEFITNDQTTTDELSYTVKLTPKKSHKKTNKL